MQSTVLVGLMSACHIFSLWIFSSSFDKLIYHFMIRKKDLADFNHWYPARKKLAYQSL